MRHVSLHPYHRHHRDKHCVSTAQRKKMRLPALSLPNPMLLCPITLPFHGKAGRLPAQRRRVTPLTGLSRPFMCHPLFCVFIYSFPEEQGEGAGDVTHWSLESHPSTVSCTGVVKACLMLCAPLWRSMLNVRGLTKDWLEETSAFKCLRRRYQPSVGITMLNIAEPSNATASPEARAPWGILGALYFIWQA